MSKKIVLAGAFLLVISIILGAMAAHALEKIVSAELIETFEKGVKYQFYTGISLLTIGLNAQKFKFSLKPFVLLSLIGVLLFSGGIYLYTMHETISSLRFTVHIVPFGGITLISAWIVFIIQIIKEK